MMRREAAWVLANVAVLLASLFAWALGQAAWLTATSSDGTIADGWSGDPVSQALGRATVATFYALCFSPLLVVVFVPYRLATHRFGHPRGIAVLSAAVLSVFTTLSWDGAHPDRVAFPVAFLIGSAALLRLPGQSLDELPPVVRGGLVGFALSCAWIVGSIVAMGVAVRLASNGALVEAGAVLVAGTAVPCLMLFADLFRDDVPGLNYAITALLLGGSAAGITFLVRAAIAHRAATTSFGQ